MEQRTFWLMVIDDASRTFEVFGKSTDDTLLTSNTVEMQRAGLEVRCQAPDISFSKEDIEIHGYKHEDGLYSRVINEYEKRTGKSLNKW
jgi:hypothetical protein